MAALGLAVAHRRPATASGHGDAARSAAQSPIPPPRPMHSSSGKSHSEVVVVVVVVIVDDVRATGPVVIAAVGVAAAIW
eukprot:87976-Chlamydomonas_euryale.AAC.3